MSKCFKLFFCTVLCITLVLSVLPAVGATGNWYDDAVSYVKEEGIMQGISESDFAPQAELTRSMLVTIIHRIEGAPVAGKAPFTDVVPGNWDEQAIAWAYENGISNGYTNGTFGGIASITRQEFVTILYRYVKMKGMEDLGYAELDFTDSKDVAPWAEEAVKWAVGSKIISGMGDGTLLPNGTTTRAQAATVFMRLDKEVINKEDAPQKESSLGEASNIRIPTENNESPLIAEGSVNVDGEIPEEGLQIHAGESVSAIVPNGVTLEDDATELTLSITTVEESESNITISETESMVSLDVHIDGVSSENIVPIIVSMGNIFPTGLNSTSINLYHVENGQLSTMEAVENIERLSAHNQFYYNPETGEIVLSLASFSEIITVTDMVNPWQGVVDTSWYDNVADKENTTNFTISNADQFVGLGKIVSGYGDIGSYGFKGKTITLTNDINLSGVDYLENGKLQFYPIGYTKDGYKGAFQGTFDGAGHTIKNIFQNTWMLLGNYDGSYYNAAMGLFGYVYGGTIKNLTVDNFASEGEFAPTGVIAAYAHGGTFENISIVNCKPYSYNHGVAGIVGCDSVASGESGNSYTFKNITVDKTNTIGSLWGSWDTGAAGILGRLNASSSVNLTNCHVAAKLDVYNDVCANYQYYWYRYCGMMIGTVSRTSVGENGTTILDLSKITAEDCTVNFGDWHEYYYCEFEENTPCSYGTPTDYQMSRIPNEEIVGVGEDAYCVGHDHTEGEDRTAVYLPFRQVFGGEGWGVKGESLEEILAGGIKDITVGQVSNIYKFNTKVENNSNIFNDKEYNVGDFFASIGGVEIMQDSVVVGITAVGDLAGEVVGTYTANTTDWAKGTILFNEGYEGVVKLSIQDYNFCTPTELYLNVIPRQPVKKYNLVFKNTDKYMYRIGNDATTPVKLSQLFTEVVGEIPGNVSVTVDSVAGNNVGATYSPNATNWKNGTLSFYGTGVVKVTITDDDYCIPTELYLEVVSGKNVTSAANATESNIVLLNDSGVTTLNISGRYSFYGNGFTLTYTGDGRFLNNGLKQGVISVSENGTLDNTRIISSIYPSAYLYYGVNSLGSYVQERTPEEATDGKKRYRYQLSTVAASGNATISNCYIYGGRNNIFVNTGNVTIEDTILECGVVANIQVQSNDSHTVTLNNVTTIQRRVSPNVVDTESEKNNVMLGAGIIVGPETTSNPRFVINGNFKQYNWVTRNDANAVTDTKLTKAIIEAAVDATAYNHTIKGETASNMGIVFMNDYSTVVDNNTGLPYALGTISMSGVSGKAYSLQNASADQIYSDYTQADKTTLNGLYKPQFAFSSNLGGQLIPKDTYDNKYCYREGNEIKIMFPMGETKELDLASLVTIEKYTDEVLDKVITCVDSEGNVLAVTYGKVVLSEQKNYTVTYTVEDTVFFNKDGGTVSKTETYTWDITLEVSLKKGIPNARFDYDTSKQVMGYAKKNFLSGGNTQYLPFLAGLKVYDYTATGEEYLRFDGDTDFNKIAKAEIKEYTSSNHVLIDVTLTDGGVISIDTTARAASGGSTYTGTLNTSGNVLYYVNGGTTSATTTTWVISNYEIIGNNGVPIKSGAVTFANCENGSVPTGSFGTTIKATINFDANGGECVQSMAYATSASTTVTLPTPSRDGYLFIGWYTAATGGTKIGGAGAPYTPTANTTLYAQWGRPSTITYDANGGSCSLASETYNGTALVLPTPTRDNYWFIGWYDDAAGGNKIGDAGFLYHPTGDATLYAHWQEAIRYTVTYEANGGSCPVTSETYEGTNLILPSPSYTGYDFNGWYDAAAGGKKIGNAGASYAPSADITLYAQWTIHTYTISVATSDKGGSWSGPTSATYGQEVSGTITYNDSQSKNFTVKTASGTQITSGSGTTCSFTMPAENVTITITSKASCLVEGTMITMADGSKKAVEDIVVGDEVITWNFIEGKHEIVPVCLAVNDGNDDFRVVTLSFEDESTLKFIDNHGVFDATLNEYAYITPNNAEEFLGHDFVKLNADGLVETVKLVGFDITRETVGCYTLQTAFNVNCVANGLLTQTPPLCEGYFDYFEMGEFMKYDAEKMQADIDTYGLYTYDDFKDYLTYDVFMAFNGPFLKIPVEKGYFTFEYLLEEIANFGIGTN